MSDNEKKSFIMYKSFRTMLLRMSMDERGRLITAIYEYIYDGNVTAELNPVTEMAFCAIKDTLDRDMESYAEKCRINSENGKKGGRPRKNVAGDERAESADIFLPKTERFFEKAKKADNDNGNGNENGNENENVNDNGDGDENENENDNGNGEVNAEASSDAVSDLPHLPLKEIKEMKEEKRTSREGCVPIAARMKLSEADRRELEAEGVPSEYIERRLERAAYYAERQKKPLKGLFREWWHADSAVRSAAGRGIPLSSVAADESLPAPSMIRSFDTDDFFSTALQRSARQIEQIMRGG